MVDTHARVPIVESRLARRMWSFFFIALGLAAVSFEVFIFEDLRRVWFSSPEPVTTMRNLVVLSAAGAALALSPRDTFYPPALNDTAYIANSSIGTYGGIYKAGTNGPTGGTPYGTYDYCSMPHPRSEEYELPEALANGSTKGKLVYLEYLQRHQRRSPYNILPGGEVIMQPCSVKQYPNTCLPIARTKRISVITSGRTCTQVPIAQVVFSPCPCMPKHTKIQPIPSRLVSTAHASTRKSPLAVCRTGSSMVKICGRSTARS